MEKMKIGRNSLNDELVAIVRQHEALRRLGVFQESAFENEPARQLSANHDAASRNRDVVLKLHAEDEPPIRPRPAA